MRKTITNDELLDALTGTYGTINAHLIIDLAKQANKLALDAVKRTTDLAPHELQFAVGSIAIWMLAHDAMSAVEYVKEKGPRL